MRFSRYRATSETLFNFSANEMPGTSLYASTTFCWAFSASRAAWMAFSNSTKVFLVASIWTSTNWSSSRQMYWSARIRSPSWSLRNGRSRFSSRGW